MSFFFLATLSQGELCVIVTEPVMDMCRICNQDIIGRVKQIICFAFHDSSLLLETCQDARQQSRIVTLFFLD